MDPTLAVLLGVLLFLVAALYAAVGHGGASGYLAVLSFFAFVPAEMATTALTLNVLVAGTAFLSFRAAGHFRRGLLAPFAVASIPAAFVGGMLTVPPRYYAWLLAVALAATAIRLGWGAPPGEARRTGAKPRALVSLPVGAGVGFISGVVGVGGGIFLSPLLLLLGWAGVRETAAVAAGFIALNSASGLLGRGVGGNLVYGELLWLLPLVLVGGLVGARLGARRIPPRGLTRLLAVVLALAAAKLVLAGL